MRKWFRLGRLRIFGAHVYLHWSVLAIVGLLAFMSYKSPIHAAVSIVSYLGVILIHEMGHALVARRLGYDVDAVRVAFFHGRCEHEAPHTESDDVLVAWGGVLAQFAVALPTLILAAAFEEYDLGYAAPAVVFLGYVNILVALVNLAPAPELDGHTAWRAIPLLRRWWSARRVTKRALGGLNRRR
jgi:Zn-dependent protease